MLCLGNLLVSPLLPLTSKSLNVHTKPSIGKPPFSDAAFKLFIASSMLSLVTTSPIATSKPNLFKYSNLPL